MRIDPSQLSEPLAHILGTRPADAAAGQKATTPAGSRISIEQLDAGLLSRLRMAAMSEAATNVGSFLEASERATAVRQAMTNDPISGLRAHGELDADRVRGLLGS